MFRRLLAPSQWPSLATCALTTGSKSKLFTDSSSGFLNAANHSSEIDSFISRAVQGDNIDAIYTQSGTFRVDGSCPYTGSVTFSISTNSTTSITPSTSTNSTTSTSSPASTIVKTVTVEVTVTETATQPCTTTTSTQTTPEPLCIWATTLCATQSCIGCRLVGLEGPCREKPDPPITRCN